METIQKYFFSNLEIIDNFQEFLLNGGFFKFMLIFFYFIRNIYINIT